MKNQEMVKSICGYIQSMDRNSDIMDAYQEVLDGELHEGTLVEICQNILTDWKEDILGTELETKRVKDYYTFLGI